MKKIRLFVIALALCGATGFYSCKDDDGPTFVTEMDAPTELTVAVDGTTAAFQWIGVDNALVYQIELATEEDGVVYSNNRTTTALSVSEFPADTYSWRVRSMRSGVYSEWAQGENFTIE